MINFCNFWKDQQYLPSIEDFCQWDIEQVADDRSVIGDRTLALKAALVPEMRTAVALDRCKVRAAGQAHFIRKEFDRATRSL